MSEEADRLSPADGATPVDFDSGDFSDGDATVVGAVTSVAPVDYPRGLTSRELAHALRGEMLDHFLLQQFIGGGGMGVVFKALDTTLDRVVAVKVVAARPTDEEELGRRFLVEAQSTARLDHPNIARIHYIGRDRGLPYIVFEYIDGLNLRDLVAQRGPLGVEEALSYAYQIAHALAHAWNREVVHRDIKPSNILITPSGQAKLVDMGLARFQQVESEDDGLTATGITLGTFDYISPEQARDPRVADCRSDIYSLGCTLFFMLTGQAPFAHGTALQKLLQHQGELPPDMRDIRSDVPGSVGALVRRMLAKAPADRQQTPVELVNDLTSILQELHVQLPQALPPMVLATADSRSASWQRRAAWLVPAMLLLLGGVWLDGMGRDQSMAPPFPPLKSAPRGQRLEIDRGKSAPEARDSPSMNLPLQSAGDGPATRRRTPSRELGTAELAGDAIDEDRQWDFRPSMWDALSQRVAGEGGLPFLLDDAGTLTWPKSADQKSDGATSLENGGVAAWDLPPDVGSALRPSSPPPEPAK